MIRNTLSILLNLLFISAFAQPGNRYEAPMGIPLYLSGNFGELRNDHFHSGIDIKTLGTTGHEVYAIAEGYVSRIKVQAGGYGHALYIAHPDGNTSVYGHLSGYIDTITAYVRDQQYKLKSFEVDLYPKPGILPVERGQVIAWSGNSGSSSGPHLHFEIRKTAGQIPTDVLQYGFPVTDNIPPVISRIAVYPRSDKSTVGNGRDTRIIEVNGESKLEEPIDVRGDIGIGVEVYDYLNGAPNRCGIRTLELFVDEHLHFRSVMDAFAFSESRFINAHIDYSARQKKGYSIQRLYTLPYNALGIYQTAMHDGIVQIRDTAEHAIRVVATDTYGNVAQISFTLKGRVPNLNGAGNLTPPFRIFPYNASGGFTDRNVRLSFDAWSFYEDVAFDYARTEGTESLYSDIFHLGDPGIPVHRHMNLSIGPERLPDRYLDKLCIVRIGDDEISYEGGEYSEGTISQRIRSFGRYSVAIDTVAPSVTPLDLYPGKDITGTPGIRFVVEDDLAGLDTYELYIDDEWTLLQYDPKNDLLICEFDSDRTVPGKDHVLRLLVTDAEGNRSEYRTTFTW